MFTLRSNLVRLNILDPNQKLGPPVAARPTLVSPAAQSGSPMNNVIPVVGRFIAPYGLPIRADASKPRAALNLIFC